MQTLTGDVAIASISDAHELATWNVERSTDQLLSFIDAKSAALPDDIDL